MEVKNDERQRVKQEQKDREENQSGRERWIEEKEKETKVERYRVRRKEAERKSYRCKEIFGEGDVGKRERRVGGGERELRKEQGERQ